MIGSVATSWRATAFAQALAEHELDEATAADRTAGGGGTRDHPLAPERLPATGDGSSADADTVGSSEDGDHTGPATLLGVAERLRALPRPELSPDVKIVQRAQLIAAAEAEFASPEARAGTVPEQRGDRGRKGAHRAPGPSPMSKLRPRSRLTKGLAAGGLGVGVAASAMGGVAAASSDALPGESLYGVKRGMEDLQLDLAGDEADRGQVHLDHAATRMKEARRLMERARGGATLDHESLSELRKALSAMRNDATEGHRLLSAAYEREGSISPMRSLSSFSTDHRARWSQLRDSLPAQLDDVGEEVSSAFDAMDDDVRPLERLLSDPSKDDPNGRGKGGEERTGNARTSPEPRSSSGSTASGGNDGAESGRPSPSGSDQRMDGLIGGGLLEPSRGQNGEPSGSESGGNGDSPPHSEVTLPPIVPDVLPGLRNLSDGH